MKYLPLITLLAALSQLVTLFFFGAGSFEGSATNALPTFIQPAGWAFSIWGLIYALSIVYAIYQYLPQNDNQALRANRPFAIVAFLGSSAWLFLANQSEVLLWLTIPTLFAMGLSLSYIVLQPDLTSARHQFYSKAILYPYAAWTGIAQWLNVQALLNAQGIITDPIINVASNIAFLSVIAVFSFYFFYRSGWSVWYGGVIAWASMGIVYTNMLESGNLIFALMGSALFLFALTFITTKKSWKLSANESST